jgi:hypothetical protein
MDVCKVDKSVINELIGMPSLRGRTEEEKLPMKKDARPCPP